jgi:CheY-like chemotaxis protein
VPLNQGTSTNKTSDAQRAARRALRVMVVEDDKDSLFTLLALLRSEGHVARGVGSAKEMWNIMRDFAPDVCLIDIGLPDR